MNRKWWKAAAVRALKTVAQTAVSMIVIGQGLFDTDWYGIVSVSIVAGIASMLTSMAGLPEVEDE